MPKPTKPKFTPGPWVADNLAEEEEQQTRVGTYDGTPLYYHRTATIALFQTNHQDAKFDDVPTIGIIAAEANARLAAASPKLYSALEKLALRTLEYVGEFAEVEGLECDEEMRALAKDGLATLAEARGDHA